MVYSARVNFRILGGIWKGGLSGTLSLLYNQAMSRGSGKESRRYRERGRGFVFVETKSAVQNQSKHTDAPPPHPHPQAAKERESVVNNCFPAPFTLPTPDVDVQLISSPRSAAQREEAIPRVAKTCLWLLARGM